jgi:hypothetical protein
MEYWWNFTARRIEKGSNAYPFAAVSAINPTGNGLRLCPALSEKKTAKVRLRQHVASLCLVVPESLISPVSTLLSHNTLRVQFCALFLFLPYMFLLLSFSLSRAILCSSFFTS